jgi:hypothetical protein
MPILAWLNDSNKTSVGYTKPATNRISTRIRIRRFASDLRWFIGYKLRSWNERINWWGVLGASMMFVGMATTVIILVLAFTAAFMR